MTKQEWQKHRLKKNDDGTFVCTGIPTCPSCKERLRTKRKNAYARSYYDAMRSVGMTKTPYGWE